MKKQNMKYNNFYSGVAEWKIEVKAASDLWWEEIEEGQQLSECWLSVDFNSHTLELCGHFKENQESLCYNEKRITKEISSTELLFFRKCAEETIDALRNSYSTPAHVGNGSESRLDALRKMDLYLDSVDGSKVKFKVYGGVTTLPTILEWFRTEGRKDGFANLAFDSYESCYFMNDVDEYFVWVDFAANSAGFEGTFNHARKPAPWEFSNPPKPDLSHDEIRKGMVPEEREFFKKAVQAEIARLQGALDSKI